MDFMLAATRVPFMNFNSSLYVSEISTAWVNKDEKFMDSDWAEGLRCGALVWGAEW